MTDLPYDRAFYNTLNEAGSTSASAVLPLVLEMLRVGSAVDVGCGTGIWALELMKLGVGDVLGVDGAYVPIDQRRLPDAQFVERDLSAELALGRCFDLALCLEVAEHLPAARAGHLISELVTLAPAVLFSAATPLQGGVDHLNEQWPLYWIERFEQHGYSCWDVLRPQIRYRPEVAWIYRQNLMLVLGPGHPSLPRMPVTARLTRPQQGDVSFEYVARYLLEREDGLSATLKRVPRLMARRMRRHP